jgi:subtilisin family serine protease
VQVLFKIPSTKSQYVLRATDYLQYDAVKASRLFAEDSSIFYAHPDFILVKKYLSIDPRRNPDYARQWYHANTGQVSGPGTATIDADIDTDLAWNFTTGDPATTIAIIDEGFDTTHLDLVPNFSYNPVELAGGYNTADDDHNGYTDDIIGWNFRDCGVPGGEYGCNTFSTPGDPDNSHGTEVVGMAVAVHNDIGVIGSCPDCSVILIQGGAVAHQDALAFEYAIQRQAKIISCSWLYEDEEAAQVIESHIKEAAAAGITIFFAIDNFPGNKCEYPKDVSAFSEVIAVAMSSNKDLFYFNDPMKPEYNSGYGDSMDLLAPGGSKFGREEFNTMLITTTDLTGELGDNKGNYESCGKREEPDYFYCCEGTSFATPLAAGVAGLILSLDRSLSPKQVQYLLQDCTDKIQPSFGEYSAINGFSTPGDLVPKHGYGRVNAFEAARIAAPVNNGENESGRGGMDIFMRDNYLDWGNTEQPSGTVFEEVRDFIPFWKSQDIKVDAPPFEVPITNSTAFDNLSDENPKGGIRNRVYVRVRNRGYRTVNSVTVKLHWADACAGFPALPTDFWDRFPADASDVSVWHPFPPKTISDLRYSGSSLAGRGLFDESQIVMFEFDAPMHPAALIRNHYCLMALVSSPDDVMPTNELKIDPQRLSMDFVTSHYNNASHRNYAIENIEEPFFGQLYVNNPYPYPIKSRIEVRKPDKIHFEFMDTLLAKEIKLGKKQRKLIRFRIDPSKFSGPGEVTVVQMVKEPGKTKFSVLGGMTYLFKARGRLKN